MRLRTVAYYTTVWPVTAAAKVTVACFNAQAIKAGQQDIKTLWRMARQPPPAPPPVLDYEAGLRRRLRNTALACRVYLAAAGGTLAVWGWSAAGAPRGPALWASMIGVLMAVTLLCLMAFIQALQHWQARRFGQGTAAEFLRTTDPWWPRFPN